MTTHPTSDRLIFFGTDAFSVPTLVQLLAGHWNVVAVVTKPDSHTGRGQELTLPAVKRLALAADIPVFQPTGPLSDIREQIAALKPAAGIVVAYGKIIPAGIRDLFPKGLINIHASLLPRYRGASPIEAALLNGDDTTGVTLMQIEAGIDTGPTYDAAKHQLAGAETRLDLYEQLSELGAEFLAAKLASILDGTIVPIPQDHNRATHVGLIKKSDGIIKWSQSAEQIERAVRAHLGWPGSRTTLAGADVIITAAHVSPKDGPAGAAYLAPSGELAVYAGSGSLIIDRLKPAGKREMTGAQFLTGHPLDHPRS
jgi:methionyl-tRNA formyltransferase